MAVVSFAVSAGIVASAVYIYHNQETIKEQIKEEVLSSVSEMIPDIVSSAVGGFNMGGALSTPTDSNTSTPNIPSLPGF